MGKNQKAYQIVLKDMMLNGPDMFKGVYDARNGNDSFMYGIQTVMEYIASSIDENSHQIFSDMFTRNMVECGCRNTGHGVMNQNEKGMGSQEAGRKRRES